MMLHALGFALAMSILAAPAEHDCRERLTPTARAPIPAQALRGLGRETALCVVLGRLGAPARDIGSGLHLLQWDVDDGRVLTLSTDGDPAQPLFAFDVQPAAEAPAPAGP